MNIYLGKFPRGEIGFKGKCSFPQVDLVFTKVKLTCVTTANVELLG